MKSDSKPAPSAPDLLDGLSFEQIRLLRLLSETPNIEGTALCKNADCSWDEMFRLGDLGLIDVGAGRIAVMRMHPTLTELGVQALIQAHQRYGVADHKAAVQDVYRGYAITHSPGNPVTSQWVASRYGVSLCAGTYDQLKGMIDTKIAHP